MSSTSSNRQWFPEITYEEIDNGISANIPFIHVPENEEMPCILFMFESRETGEFEPGSQGEQLPIVEMDLHQYADLNFLKTRLDLETYNKIRYALGLDPLEDAIIAGSEITKKIRENIEENY